MVRHPLVFYFDYISPFAYLASLRIEAIGARLGARVEPTPVLFAGLLNHFGQLGPAEIAPKRRWAFRRALRRADQLGVKLEPPPHHPFNPLLALRVTRATPEAQRWSVIHALFEATWGNGRGVEQAADIREALRGLDVDVDQLLHAAATDSVKVALRAATERAIEQGVFGVPTCLLDSELYWGEDTFDDMVLEAEAGGPQQDARLERWLSLGATAQRQR
ncbi:MAG TPA: 2-hydroxychromene-2-carboxylate isomerase, partial [Polyangiaceae bacterium]|jgi:2-hydroxychromene-2-carboxylate isomerase|nr:2-hydroxychromene-2-carboxylate isomerase [Polyangiaceae bacterium]